MDLHPHRQGDVATYIYVFASPLQPTVVQERTYELVRRYFGVGRDTKGMRCAIGGTRRCYRCSVPYSNSVFRLLSAGERWHSRCWIRITKRGWRHRPRLLERATLSTGALSLELATCVGYGARDDVGMAGAVCRPRTLAWRELPALQPLGRGVLLRYTLLCATSSRTQQIAEHCV